jgi:YVTN family beta-propeller protein
MIYVANKFDNSLSVINGMTNKVDYIISAIDTPASVAVNPNTNMIYVANYGTLHWELIIKLNCILS